MLRLSLYVCLLVAASGAAFTNGPGSGANSLLELGAFNQEQVHDKAPSGQHMRKQMVVGATGHIKDEADDGAPGKLSFFDGDDSDDDEWDQRPRTNIIRAEKSKVMTSQREGTQDVDNAMAGTDQEGDNTIQGTEQEVDSTMQDANQEVDNAMPGTEQEVDNAIQSTDEVADNGPPGADQELDNAPHVRTPKEGAEEEELAMPATDHEVDYATPEGFETNPGADEKSMVQDPPSAPGGTVDDYTPYTPNAQDIADGADDIGMAYNFSEEAEGSEDGSHESFSLQDQSANSSEVSPTTGNVKLLNRWQAYGGSYGTPTWDIRDGFCFVNGLIKHGGWGTLVNIPAPCRPSKRLIFNLNNHAKTARVDVTTDGNIHWITGGRDHSWISLTGIVLATSTATRARATLPLVRGWRAYGGSYGTPSYTLGNGYCEVEGLLRGSHWGHLVQLPEECWPKKRLIFNMNNHAATARVDVLSNGQIHWVTGGRSHGWLSLSGMIFDVTNDHANSLPMASGWNGYLGSYGGGSYTSKNGICVVEALLRGSSWGHLATLPTACRPKKRLIFNLNNHAHTTRVDVESSGKVSFVTGGRSHGWISLSGLSLAVEDKGGKAGPAGKDGKPGAAGKAGAKGPPGSHGAKGPPGSHGAKGPPGSAGKTGPHGKAGSAGKPGSHGAPGAHGKPGAKGSAGAKAPPRKKVDCKYGSWLSWAACPVTCGSGTITRTRNVATYPQGGGKTCTGKSVEEKACHAKVNPCPVTKTGAQKQVIAQQGLDGDWCDARTKVAQGKFTGSVLKWKDGLDTTFSWQGTTKISMVIGGNTFSVEVKANQLEWDVGTVWKRCASLR